MDRRFSIGRIIISIIAVLLVIVFVFMLYNDSKLQNFISQTSQTPVSNADRQQHEQLISQNVQKVQDSVKNNFGSIVLYGDEYAGNGSLANEIYSNINNELFGKLNAEIKRYPGIIGHFLEIPVSNFEVHDENLDTIMTRIGTETVFVAKDFTMPAKSGDGVDVLLKTASGTPLELSIQSYTSLGTVTIKGIEGKLSRSHIEEPGSYIFRRETDGEETNVVSGSKVSFTVSEQYRECVPVIFFGNNDYKNIDSFVKRHKSIIDHQLQNDKYIIVCRTPANSELAVAMTDAFEANYIRTDEQGSYNDLAEKIYFRMNTLKYFEPVSDSVKQAEKRIFDNEE